MGADPLDHPGPEILLDAFEGAGGHDFELIGFELEAMRAVVVPDADALDIFARGNGGRRTDNGNQLPLPLDLDPQDAEAGLFAMEGDALYGTGEAFDGGISRVRLNRGESLMSEGIICRRLSRVMASSCLTARASNLFRSFFPWVVNMVIDNSIEHSSC